MAELERCFNCQRINEGDVMLGKHTLSGWACGYCVVFMDDPGFFKHEAAHTRGRVAYLEAACAQGL